MNLLTTLTGWFRRGAETWRRKEDEFKRTVESDLGVDWESLDKLQERARRARAGGVLKDK